MAKCADWRMMGWQGMTVWMPAAWEPARIQGDDRQGYVSFDDGTDIRLEISFRPTPRRLTAERAVAGQLETLGRSARKKRLEFHWERKIKLPRVKGGDYEIIWWKADFQAYELIRICTECNRMLLVRVQGRTEETGLRETAAGVFASIADHAKGDQQTWALLGLEVKLPIVYRLTRWSLRAGLSELELSDGTTDLHVARVSLGRKLLESQTYLEWMRKFYGARLKGYDCEWTKSRYREHLAVEAVCELPLTRRLLARKQRRYRRVRSWFCDVADKILVFGEASNGQESDEFEALCRTVVCHG